MPTVLRLNGYRFYFYSHEPNEPPHFHVDKGSYTLKAWLDPVALAKGSRFRPHEINVILPLVAAHRPLLRRLGMNISPRIADTRVADVRCDADKLSVDLMDGRTITVPLAWYPRLLAATAEQRAHWEMAGSGYGIYWPEIDDDLSTEGMLRGVAGTSVRRPSPYEL